MAEIREIEHFDCDGNLITKTQYEVSDAQLEIEAAENLLSEMAETANEAFTLPYVAQCLKALAKIRG